MPRFAEHRARRGPIALAVALVTFVPLSLHAEEEDAGNAPIDAANVDPEARRLAERGLAHYEAGRYGDAIDDFQASYRMTAAPGLLYNLAQAHRRKGDCAVALELYRRFLAENPAGNIRRLTESRIAETEDCAAQEIREARVPATPKPELKLPSPASASGTTSMQMTVDPRPVPHRNIAWRRPTGIGAGAAALVLAVASARYGWQAEQASDDVSAIYAREGTWGPYAIAREKSGQQDERTALWLGASALVATGISAWLLLRQ